MEGEIYGHVLCVGCGRRKKSGFAYKGKREEEVARKFARKLRYSNRKEIA